MVQVDSYQRIVNRTPTFTNNTRSCISRRLANRLCSFPLVFVVILGCTLLMSLIPSAVISFPPSICLVRITWSTLLGVEN